MQLCCAVRNSIYNILMSKAVRGIDLMGMKKTPTRVAVLSLFHKTSQPLDADTICSLLEGKGIKSDRVTVYRTLNKLTDYSVLKRVEFGEGKFRFELASLPHHHHLICTNCGKIDDINECGVEEIEQKLQKRTGFLIQQHNAEFFGLCASCQ